MSDNPLTAPIAGSVEEGVRAEFPGLRLDWVRIAGRTGPSPRSLRARLSSLSNRLRGDSVVAMRAQPITHAYRAFYRQVGLDPDVVRVPSEQAAVRRLLHGHFRSTDLLGDALLVAVVETGVPVWALDADRVAHDGPGIRLSRDGDRLGNDPEAQPLTPGRLVVADGRCVHALLFGELASSHTVEPQTQAIVLYTVGVPGVPSIHLEEALWLVAEILAIE